VASCYWAVFFLVCWINLALSRRYAHIKVYESAQLIYDGVNTGFGGLLNSIEP